MKVSYVIKNISNGQYYSINKVWDDWNMCKEFECEQDAINELYELGYGAFIIEKVYKL